MRRDAAGQVQERLEPRELAVGEQFHLGPAVGAADHGTDGQDDHVVQSVNHVVRPRVGQVLKVAQKETGRLAIHWQAPRIEAKMNEQREASRPIDVM